MIIIMDRHPSLWQLELVLLVVECVSNSDVKLFEASQKHFSLYIHNHMSHLLLFLQTQYYTRHIISKSVVGQAPL